jgi:hypothetical protein
MLPGIKKVWRLIKSASKVSQTINENSLKGQQDKV